MLQQGCLSLFSQMTSNRAQGNKFQAALGTFYIGHLHPRWDEGQALEEAAHRTGRISTLGSIQEMCRCGTKGCSLVTGLGRSGL